MEIGWNGLFQLGEEKLQTETIGRGDIPQGAEGRQVTTHTSRFVPDKDFENMRVLFEGFSHGKIGLKQAIVHGFRIAPVPRFVFALAQTRELAKGPPSQDFPIPRFPRRSLPIHADL